MRETRRSVPLTRAVARSRVSSVGVSLTGIVRVFGGQDHKEWRLHRSRSPAARSILSSPGSRATAQRRSGWPSAVGWERPKEDGKHPEDFLLRVGAVPVFTAACPACGTAEESTGMRTPSPDGM